MFVLSISLCSKILYIRLLQTHCLSLYVLLSFIALVHYTNLWSFVNVFLKNIVKIILYLIVKLISYFVELNFTNWNLLNYFNLIIYLCNFNFFPVSVVNSSIPSLRYVNFSTNFILPVLRISASYIYHSFL